MSLNEASKILGLAPSTLRNLRRHGVLDATLVRMGRGAGRLVIQTIEVERLKDELSKKRGANKNRRSRRLSGGFPLNQTISKHGVALPKQRHPTKSPDAPI
jgi:hypothetical protein